MLTYYGSYLERKLKYVRELASVQGIHWSFLRWRNILDEILMSIGFNVLFNFYLDFSMLIQVDFIIPQEFLQTYRKAVYGVSTYDNSVYDPIDITIEDVKKCLWNLRYKFAHEDYPIRKHYSESLMKHVDSVKEIMKRHNVSPIFIDYISSALSYAEGKVLTSAYWDFACWDVSVWIGDDQKFEVRNSSDLKSIIKLSTIRPWESHWDYHRWDYAVWMDEDYVPPSDVAEKLAKIISDFHARVEPVWQHVFFLQRLDNLHWKGGEHQLKLKDLEARTKAILDRRGVVGWFRVGYINFVRELYYLKYEPHRLWKRWKKILSRDDLIEKYKRMGCDEAILRELASLVPP